MNFPYQLIDLTHTLNADIPTWNGKCGFHHDIQMDYSDCPGEDKFRVMKIKSHAGIGTHMDAPSHLVEGGKNIDEFDINQFVMPCVVIDIVKKANENYSLSEADVLNFEENHGKINAGSMVMVHTGWDMFWKTPKKYHNNHMFPSVSGAAAKLLVKRNIAALGIDTLSPDRPSDGFPVHRALLGAGKFIVENVTNLKAMPTTGAFAMALPMKIQHATEAPIRLVGLLSKGLSVF